MPQRIEEYLMLILIFVTTIAGYAGPAVVMKQDNDEASIAILKYKDAIVHLEPVRNEFGAVFGFRIDLLNASTNKNIVLLFKEEGIKYHVRMRLYDSLGKRLSPRTTFERFRSRRDEKDYSYDPVMPGSGRIWFVPIPLQILADTTMPDGPDNMKPIESGTYKVDVLIGMRFFMWDNGMEMAPELPTTDYMSFRFLKLAVEVDQNSVDQDVFGAWLQSHGGTSTVEKKQ